MPKSENPQKEGTDTGNRGKYYTRKPMVFPLKTDIINMKKGAKGKMFHFKMEKVDMEFCSRTWYDKYQSI